MSLDEIAVQRCENLDDPRLEDYRSLKLPPSGRYRGQKHFVVEGRKLCERLLLSDFPIRSMLVERGLDRSTMPAPRTPLTIFEMSREQLGELAGFDFHRGWLASAQRPADHGLDQFQPDAVSLALVGISDMENVGSMLRSAAAFGIRQIVLDRQSVDPFSRRAMRVSMGAAMTMRYYRLPEVVAGIRELQSRGTDCLAATLTDDSVSIDQYRTWYKHGDRPCVLVMGNEGNGLPLAVQRNCRHRIRIAMRPTIVGAPLLDSLNVSVAAAILMHDLTRTRSPTECDSPD
ncbi:TrmH family RNA methyltransferase [Roseiconus lacunae]|uniref:RNA methyltransferase n=1 Tax=Roseiconus lacunae TaxID=2605694 RepID=A0ABT7PL91_9BACT|nr:RNA methyltransferase [Roseiconus lacunae]MDM4017238.1 RNA methyltransferase [Roseiconus lacunae]